MQALNKIRNSDSFMNYERIFNGFLSKGILQEDIKPRENVLTFKAWRELNRTVRKGEKGIQVITWIECEDKQGGKFKKCKTAYVFHISQTEILN